MPLSTVSKLDDCPPNDVDLVFLENPGLSTEKKWRLVDYNSGYKAMNF